ncbi:hypothetical protein HN51_031223, partial [Arachis hypogaea]
TLTTIKLSYHWADVSLLGILLMDFITWWGCYGLAHGSWMKLLYVGEDIFIVIKVKDSCMTTKEFSCLPSISLIAIKPHGPPNKNEPLETLCYPLAVFPLSVSTCYTPEVQTVYMQDVIRVNFQRDDGFMSVPSLNESYVLSDPSHPCIINSNGMSNQGNDFMENQHQLLDQTLLNCNTLNNYISSASHPTIQTEKKHAGNNIMSPLISSGPGTAIQGAQPLTCLKLLTSTQVQNSAVVIPLRFAESAFPNRHNHVNVILNNGSCYRMGLRWSKKKKVQLYLMHGWKTFAKYNGFRACTVLEFSILPSDETILHVKILKI